MTLLTVVQDVCAAVGVLRPQSVFSGLAGNRTMQEMVSLANEMAQRIAYDTRDWTKLRTTHTVLGDSVWVPATVDPDPIVPGHFEGGSSAFSLPANFKRMLLTSNVWRSSSTQYPMTFVPDTDEWIRRRVGSESSAFGEWALIGGQMHIWPIMHGPVPAVPGVSLAVPAESAYYGYLDKNCIALSGGGFGDQFQNDLDTFALDERILKLGMIWQWKAQKGSAYAEDLGTYSDALAVASGHDSPAPIIIGRRVSSWQQDAYSWPS
jgi:hypothetical protein